MKMKIRRALVLIFAFVFLAGMPLSSYMVNAGEGGDPNAADAGAADVGQEVPQDTAPAADSAAISDPVLVSDPAPVVDSAPVSDPAPVVDSAPQQEQPVMYTAIWYNEDGTSVLYSNTYEQIPNSGLYTEQPVKAADENYTYTFSGWTDNGSADGTTYTYTAQYTAEPIMITVQWLNWDGTVFLSSEPFAKGEPEPTTDQKPTKEDAEYIYTFDNWGEGVWDETAKTITYTPQFTEAIKKETKFDLYPDPKNRENKLVVTVENIPVNPGLKMKEENAAEEKYKSAVEEILKTEAPSKKDCKEDTYLFALDFDPGVTFGEEITVNVQGKDLKDLPSESLLYRVNVQEQNKIEKIDDYTFENTTNADTAEEEGKLTFKTRAFSVFVLVVPGAEHKPETTTTRVEATCEEEGVETTITSCSVCGEELNREETKLSALGHDWDDGKVTKSPTCTDAGEKVFTCKRDKTHTRTEILAATGHKKGDAVVENRIEAKAGQAGSYDEVIYCVNCNKELSRKKVTIPALPATETKTASKNIAINTSGEKSLVYVTAKDVPVNAALTVSAVDSSVIRLVESSTINGVKYKVWFAANVGLSSDPGKKVSVTLQSDKLKSLPEGALLYRVNTQKKSVVNLKYDFAKGKNELTFKTQTFAPFVIVTPVKNSQPATAHSSGTKTPQSAAGTPAAGLPQTAAGAPGTKSDTQNITLNEDGETSVVSVTAADAPETASLSISSVDSSIIDLVQSSSIGGVRYDVWFAVDINMGGNLEQSASITVQSDKLTSLPDGALLYHVNPQTNKVRKTNYSHNRGDNKLTFKSKEFSPFVILVKRTTAAEVDTRTDSTPLYTGSGGGGGYYPAGDNGTWDGGESGGGGGWVGGFNETSFGDAGAGRNDTEVLGGRNETGAAGFNKTGARTAGSNETSFAGKNDTNTTGVAAMTNTTDTGNTTSEKNETAVEKSDESSGSGGISRGVLIGIIAAIIAAVAVAFGVSRYLKNGRRKE